MFKKLLSLGIALVMLSGVVLIAPEVSPALDNAHASEEVTEVTASDFEAIAVTQYVGTDSTTTELTGGFKPGSSETNLYYNYTSSTTTTPKYKWLYFKYDISGLKDIEAVKSAVLSIGYGWGNNGGMLYVKELEESVWNDAVATISEVEKDSTTVVDSSKFVFPTDATTLGTVKRDYGNAKTTADSRYSLTGIEYQQTYQTTYTDSKQWRTATMSGGPLVDYVQKAVKADKDYLYFSVCYTSTVKSTNKRYGTYNFYTSANSIKASNDVYVLHNSVAGTKFNTTVTTLNRETDFTYTVNIATKDTNVRLLAAIYGKYGALSGVVMSDTLSSNNGNLSLAVPLSEYPDATSVRCFIWDGNTLRPYAEPKETPVKTLLQEQFSGKKVIFIGNSHIYYGRSVEAPPTSEARANELSARIGDQGGFYQLCKQNGIDVSVTNWTFGAHKLGNIFGGEACYVNDSCQGVIHKDKLTDNNYDYVVVSPGVGTIQEQNFAEDIKMITDFFKEGNPNVKVIILGNASGQGVNSNNTPYPGITSYYKTLYNEGYPIADWGYLVKNLIDGTETVEGATQTYNKNTFIVKDKYHPNMLSGYITTLFTYCTITGEKAEGQPYMYFWNANTAPDDVASYVEKYYNNGDADTTFPEILKSEADIRGIQKLVDKYMEEKAFLTEY